MFLPKGKEIGLCRMGASLLLSENALKTIFEEELQICKVFSFFASILNPVPKANSLKKSEGVRLALLENSARKSIKSVGISQLGLRYLWSFCSLILKKLSRLYWRLQLFESDE